MEPPSFSTTGPQVVRAAPGSDANLVLPLPSGSPPFHYEWSRAGAKLDDRFKSTDGAGGVRLTISTVSTGDSGVYTLQASNAAGEDTTRVRLEVSPDEKPTGEDPPTFLRRLQDLTVKVGTRTRFLVEIVSSTECRVTWYRNERRLLEAERIALVRDGNFWCADISAVSVDDAGRWTCTAENVGGRASCSAHLNVLVPKAYKRPEFVEELRALLTEQGTVSLECKVVGVPTPVLRWFKDSREIKAGDVFALTANAEDPTSLGTYTCEAVNCMGRAYSSSKVHVIGRSSREGSARPTSGGHVPLEPPPIFTKELEDQFVRICEPLTLSCNIVVPPWPRSIVWYNKEGKIEPNEKYRVLEDGVGGYLVEVPSAEWPDEGEWKCVATSSAGRIGITTCYVSMDVPKNYRKPRFMENLQAVLTEEGLVSFECKVVGFPTPVLSWFKDGQELKPGDVYQLTGTNSLGSYCCIARNCMGQASSSAELTVEDIQNQLNEEEKLQLFSKNQAPKFLQGLKSVDAKIDEPFRFTIKVAIPPEPTVLWYRDDQPVDESSRCHLGKEERGVFFLDIQSLEFMDQAEWKCVAMNDFGHSVTSCFLKLIIPRHYKKPRFLENLQAILSDEGAVNLECKVIGVPQPVLKWYKDGEELKPGDIHRIISGQDGTCCLGTYTCEAQNCMGIAASSASLLGFEDSIKTKGKKNEDEQTLQRNLSLSTIHEERTSQMYDTPVGDITLDDKGEISFSFDGKEVSVSLYETPDLTEEEALQIVEMYADQLSENVTEHNVVELPPLRFVKETSTSGNLLMEAIIIDVSPEYFTTPEEDLRTEADVEDISIADENGPPQLSLDGEDYLEKNMTLLSDEKANFPKKIDRKKSDSQKSADDYFSLSRDQSLSDEKKDDDTQALSESDLQSFASAHSSGKVKSKPSVEDGQESSDITKTVLLKEDLQTMRQQNEIDLVMKNKRERRSRSSRRSSSGSEISLNKMREDVIDGSFANNLVATVLDRDKITAEINTVNSTLTKLINDVQVIERDIILKSELMPTAATASRSLEIINSLITPLSEIHSIAEAIKESINESFEITTSLFNRFPQPLSILHQSLTIIEKCIDLQRENKTLVKKTCTNIIEKCADDMNKLVIDINSIVNKDCPFIEDTCVSSIHKTNNEILNTIICSVAAIKEYKEVSEKIDSKLNKITPELEHLQKTQKAVYELRNPLQSLLHIAEAVDMSGSISLGNVTNTQIILNDMSAPIQALQTALEQVEFLSVTETQSGFQKYNTEIMETVMDSVIKLRTSFEQLSVETGTMEDVDVLKKVLVDVKHNINDISSHLDVIEAKIGPFDVLQSENKLEALQKMAQILINLENNLVTLDVVPCLKIHMTDFHKNLTKVLEHVIESNEATKYLTFLEICDGINRLNSLMKNIDAKDILSLAGISNNLKILQANVKKNVFTSDLKFSINSNVTDLLVAINETMNHADTSIYTMISENLEDFSIKHYEEGKLNIVLEQMEKAISSISYVVSLETTKDLDIKQAFNKIIPTLEEIKWCIASLTENVNEQEENISDMSNSTFTQAVANPLCELNHGISVINQIICEKALDYSENEIKLELVTPLLELRNALEILQQDVISQNGENVNSHNIISSAANAVQSVKSCIIMIQEQDLLENLDELSTLEDISAIKTSADILSSDHLLSPSVHEISTEIDLQVPTKFETQIINSVSVQILRNLNDHILILQRPEIVETLDELSKHDEYSSIQSIMTGINTIHCAIEDILHPVTLEESQELSYFVSPTQLSAIIQPVQKLHDYLLVLDINNVLIEGIIKTDETKCLSQYLSKLERCLRDSIDCLHVAIETADVTLEISTQIEKLRRLCVELKDNLDTAKNHNIVDSSELIILDASLTTVLDTTNCNQEINITSVKLSLERLQQNIASVQDEILGFAVENPVVLHHETKILKSVADIENTIASLAVLQFVNIDQISDFTFCDSQQVDKEVVSGQSKKIENIVETIENCIQQLSLDMPNNNNLMSVKDFVKTFNDEITLLCCLFNQKPTPKRIIKMLQIFYDLNKNLKQCQLNQEMSGTSADFYVGSATLEEGLQNIRALLLEVLDTQKNLVFNIPISNITNVEIILNEILETNKNASLQHFVKLLMNTIESIKPCINNIHIDIVKELKSSDVILTVDDDTDKNFALLFKYLSEKTENKDIEGELDFSAIFRVIQKHADCKHVKGTGKKLIYINCISEGLNVLKQMLNDLESKKGVLNVESTSSSDYELNKLLIELSGPFKIFYKKIMNICIENLQITDRTYTLKDLELLELQEEAINMAKVAEKILKCENLVIDSDCSTKTIAKDFVSKIHSIEKSLENLESSYSVQMIMNIKEPIKEIEKIISSLLTEEVIREENKQSREKSGSLLQHMEQYIEIIEIVEEVCAVIKLNEFKKSADIVRELRDSITSVTYPGIHLDSELNIREEQIHLVKNLQKALTTLQTDALDSEQELVPHISDDIRQHIIEIVSDLQNDLVALMNTPVVLEKSELSESVKPMDPNYISLIQEEESIPIPLKENENEQLAIINSEGNLEESLNIICTDLTCDFPKIIEIEEIPLHIEISSATNLEIFKEKQSLDLKSDIDHLYSNIQDLSAMKFDQSRELLIHHINDYLCKDIIEDIKKLVPCQNFEQLEQSLRIAVEVRDNAVSEDSDHLAQQVFLKKQLELVLNLQEVMLRIHSKNLYDVNHDPLKPLIENKSLLTAKSVVQNLFSSLQLYIALLNTIIQAEVLTDGVRIISKQPCEEVVRNSTTIHELKICDENISIKEDPAFAIFNENQGSVQDFRQETDNNTIFEEDNNLNHLDMLTEVISKTGSVGNEHVNDESKIDANADKEQSNAVLELETLLQEVNETLHLSQNDLVIQNSDSLQDILQEVQTVILKLKCDFDGSTNDTLNENIEDLECNVRSVQLQINENCPPALLNEACANLQTLAACINNVCNTQSIFSKENNALCACKDDAKQTLDLLEEVSFLKVDINIDNIICNLNSIKDAMKYLNSCFMDDAESLILKGIEVLSHLNDIEDKVFALEKEIEANNEIDVNFRDSLIAVTHSIYGSISNMRGNLCSIQKKYMYDNYGKPTHNFLKSIKNVNVVLRYDKKDDWKKFENSLRTILKHFEDIKFYINFDKTARLPSDSAFTKIILSELRNMLSVVVLQNTKDLDMNLTSQIEDALNYVSVTLNNMENRSTLEVKEKIPIFMELSMQMHDITNQIKILLKKSIDNINEPSKVNEELSKQEENLEKIPLGYAEYDEKHAQKGEELKKKQEYIEKSDIQNTESHDRSIDINQNINKINTNDQNENKISNLDLSIERIVALQNDNEKNEISQDKTQDVKNEHLNINIVDQESEIKKPDTITTDTENIELGSIKAADEIQNFVEEITIFDSPDKNNLVSKEGGTYHNTGIIEKENVLDVNTMISGSSLPDIGMKHENEISTLESSTDSLVTLQNDSEINQISQDKTRDIKNEHLSIGIADQEIEIKLPDTIAMDTGNIESVSIMAAEEIQNIVEEITIFDTPDKSILVSKDEETYFITDTIKKTNGVDVNTMISGSSFPDISMKHENEISTLESSVDSIVAFQNDNSINEINQDKTRDIKNEHLNIDIVDQESEIKLPDTITTDTENIDLGSIKAADEKQNIVQEITMFDSPDGKNILDSKEEGTYHNTGIIEKENVLDVNTMISVSSLPNIDMKHENEISTLESTTDGLVTLQNDSEINEISQDKTRDIKNEHLNIDIVDQESEIKQPGTITMDTGNIELGSIKAADEKQNIVEEITMFDSPDDKNILDSKEEGTYHNTDIIEKANVLDVNTMISVSSLPNIDMKHENEISTLESSTDGLVTLQNDSEINEISQDKTRDIKNEHLNIDIVDQESEIKQPDTITTDTENIDLGSIKAADEKQNIVEEITMFDFPDGKNILDSKEEGTYHNTGIFEKENVLDVNTMIRGSSLPDIGMKHENKISPLESSTDSLVTLQNNSEINEISQDKTRDIKNEHLNIDIVDQESEIKQPDTITTDTENIDLGSIKAADEKQNIVEEITMFDSPDGKNILDSKEEGTYHNTGIIEKENVLDVNTMISGSSLPDIGMKHENKISPLESSTDSLVTLQNNSEINEISQDKTRDIKNEHLNIDIVDQESEIKQPDTITTETGNTELGSIKAADEIQNIVEEITIFDSPDINILVSKEEGTYHNTGIIEKENVLDVNTMISGSSLPDIGMKHENKISTLESSTDRLVTLQNDREINEISQNKTRDIKNEHLNIDIAEVIEIKLPATIAIDTGNIESVSIMAAEEIQNIVEEITIFDTPDKSILVSKDEEKYVIPGIIEKENVLNVNTMISLPDTGMKHATDTMQESVEKETQKTNLETENVINEKIATVYPHQYENDNFILKKQDEESEKIVPDDINTDITCYINIEEESKIQSKEEVSSNEIEAKVSFTTKNKIETDIQIDRDITSETSNQVASQTNEKVEQTAVSPAEVLTSSVLDSVVTESLLIEKPKEVQSTTTAKQLTPEDYKSDIAVPLKQQRCKKNISLDSLEYTEPNYDDIKDIETKINDNTGKTEEIQQYKIHVLDSESTVESFKVEEYSLIETITDTESRKYDDKFTESQEAIASVFENVQGMTEFKDDPKKDTSENNSNYIEFSESTDPKIIEVKADNFQANLHKVGAKELDINDMKMSDGEVIEKKNVRKTEHDINIVKDGHKSQVDITVVEFDKSTPLNTSEECTKDSQNAEYSMMEKMRQSDILINLEEVTLSINAPKMEETAQNLKAETESQMISPKQKAEKRNIKHEQCVKSHIKQSEPTEKKLEEGTEANDNEILSKDNEEQFKSKLQNTLIGIENITQEEKINEPEEVEIISEVDGALLNKSISGDTEKLGDLKEIQKDKLSTEIYEFKNDEEQDIEVALASKEILSVHENIIIAKDVPESKESDITGSNQSQKTKIIKKEKENENQLSSGYDQLRDKSFEEHFEEKESIQSTLTNNNEKILNDEVKENRDRSKDTVQEEIDSKQPMKKLLIQESFGIEMSQELISSIKIGDSTEVTLLGNQSEPGDLKLEKENICEENFKVKQENIEPNIQSESEQAEIEVILPNTANKKEKDSNASNQKTDVNKENKDGIALKEKIESINEEQSQTQEPLETIENVVMPDTKYEKQDEKPKLKSKKSIKGKDNEKRHLKKLEEANSQILEKSQKNKSRNDDSELTEQKEEVEHQYGKDMITEENGNNKKPVNSLGEHAKVKGDINNEQEHSFQQIPEEIFLHGATIEKEASAGLKNREKNDTEQNIPEEILRDEPMEAAYLRDNQQQKKIDEQKRDEHIEIIHKRGKCTLDEEKIENKNTDRNQKDQNLVRKETTDKTEKALGVTLHIETGILNVEMKVQEDKPKGEEDIPIRHPNYSLKQQKIIDAGKNDEEIKLTIREISPVNKSNEFEILKPCEASSDKHISLIEECTGSKKLQKPETVCTEFQVDEKHTLTKDYSLHDQSAYYSDEVLGTVEDKIANNSADIPQNNILSRKETKLNSQVKKHKEIKYRPSFIDHSVPDYGDEFARPRGCSTKSVYIDNSPMEIKTTSKSPTTYRAQTLIHESQLKSSLPPNIDQRTNISEGRTEHKQRLNTTNDLKSTISDKRGSYPRDFKRKPVFSTYLTDRTAVESSRVKLTCSVLSSTDPEISWYKNGVLLDDKHKCRVKYVNGLITLEILNAVPSDSGEYSCTVKNENGSITSSANLKVYPGFEASPIPPTFTRSIRDFYHSHENELVLECRIRGQPLPTITWLKDNRPIILNERYQAHYLADGVCRLTILSPNEDDSGKYTCKAENSMWSDKITHEVYFTSKGSHHMRNITTSENIRFTRQATESRRPHFTNVLSDHKVVTGGTIGLQVEICGSPTRVEWLREGRSVTETYSNAQTYIDRGLYTLALSDVTEKESGLYTCRAWSTQGPVEMNASITVVQPNQFDGKPATIISRPVKDLLISVGEDLNISFRAQGEPKPKVFFMKGIRDITNNQRVCKMTSDDYVKFTLKRSVISDAGTYCIFVRNAYGCDRAFVTVVIRQRASSDHLISDWTYPMDDLAISVVDRNYQSVPDRIPSEPSIVDGGNNWVSLAWPKPVSQVKAPILAYKVEGWLLGKEGGARWVELGITPRNCFDAFNLKQGEEYHFRVTPRNRYGWGESVQTSTPIGIGLAGDRPEFIEILPGQLKVLVGETATLYCSFKGNPIPDIVWMKNGHEVEEETERVIVQLNGSNTSLQINDIKIEDEGRYSCEATNVHGRSSTYSRMAVIKDRQIWAADAKLKRERSAGANGEYPPQFTMRLRDRRVQATYPVRLTCQVIGSPSPLVTWFKDGEEVSVDSRRTTYKDEYFYTLEIAPTTLDDGGVYEAMARNSSGAISCRCNLVVDKGIRAYIAPEFCCGFEPLYRVCEGDELRISAIVEAYPSVGVTWYRDGVRLRPSRRAIMTLDRDGQIELALASVAARDAGVYTCTASNEVGRASTSGKVEVLKGEQRSETPKVPPIIVSPDVPYSKEPMFIKKPRSSEAREGDTVIIECEVIGDPKPEVYWLRDFLKPDYYRDASHFKRVGAGSAYRFEIPHAKFDYTGAYSIVAKNVHGEAKAIISLQILAKDSTCSDDTHNIRYGRVEVIPRFEKELTDLLCYDGDAIEFECRVSGNPEPFIRWFHYTEVLPECPDFETSYDLGTARLKIKQVTADDEGPYSCEASNNLGKAISSACLVIYPPGEPNTLSQRLHRPPALLSASSTPRSTPRTTPARSLSRTPGPDHRRLCSPSREIAPKFYTYPYNRVVEEGDTVVFQCAVKGLPPPWATWDKDGIIITPTARIRIREKDDVFRMLEIEQVTIEDVGLYRVTLENDYGRAEASARLEVISQTGKFYGSRSYSVSPRKCLPYRRRTPSLTRQD